MIRSLEATDSRHLRAIAKSPSHITHESSTALRARLKVLSPGMALVELLKRRITGCQDAVSKDTMQTYLSWLQKQVGNSDFTTPDPSDLGTTKLVPCLADTQVACPVCGLYFPGMRIMLSHKARQHPVNQATTSHNVCRPRANDYTSHTVSGLPQCRHCLKTFTRVEAMQKHLLGACPVLHGAHAGIAVSTSVATDSEVLGAPGQEGLLGHSCRVPQAAPANRPLIEDPIFLATLHKGWRQAAADDSFLRILRKHCVYCHQWVSLRGPGVKQHHRLAHPTYWSRKDDACSLCSSAGLSTSAPCKYCGEQYKDQRAHLKRCHVLYQIALASLTHPQAAAEDHGGGCSHGSSAGAGSGLGEAGQGEGQAHQRRRARPGEGGTAKQVAETVLQRLLRERPARMEQVGQGHVPVVARPASAGLSHHPPSPHADKHDFTDGGGDREVSSRYRLHAVRGHRDGAEHPPAFERRRPIVAGTIRSGDSDYFPEDSSLWRIDQEAPRHPPAGLNGRCSARPSDDSASGREHGFNADLGLLPVGPQSPAASEGRATSAGPRPGHALPRCPDENGTVAAGVASVPYGSQAGSGDQGRSGAFQAGSQPEGPSLHGLLHGPVNALLLRGPQASGSTTPPGTDAEVCHGSRVGGSLPVGAIHRLDEAASALDEPGAESEGRRQLRPRPDAVPISGVVLQLQLPVPSPLQSLPARLKNPHAVCYLNACAQAFCWVGNLLAAPRPCLGSAQAALKLLRKSGTPYLPSCLAWGPILRGWRGLCQQNDAAEFMTHLLRVAQPEAYQGQWQARVSNPVAVVDTGPLAAPILLDVSSP